MTPAPSTITFMAMPLDGSGTAARTKRPAAAPSVHGPERFRNALAALRCSFGGPTPAGQITLQTANYAVAVPEPERLWEISPSVGFLERTRSPATRGILSPPRPPSQCGL